MKTANLSLIFGCVFFYQTFVIAQTSKTTSKPDVEVNIEGKIEININGNSSENTTTKGKSVTTQPTSKNIKNETKTNSDSMITIATSKFDFIAGDKVLAIEDFSTANIGDFPLNWNTNSSAEVVSLNNQNGKWLQLNQKGAYLMEAINQLPDNFTFEFDVVCTSPFGFNSSGLYINFANLKNRNTDYVKWMEYAGKNDGVKIMLEASSPGGKMAKMGNAGIFAYNANQAEIKNIVKTPEFNDEVNPKAHIAIWRQKERVRVYINQTKVFDIPKAMLATSYNTLFFSTKYMYSPDNYYISNIKFAVGGADTRTQLIDEGNFSTNGILFDVNSDVIKPESNGVLLSIAKIMNENSEIRIKIVGHTDSDGDATKNLELSKKRANAVKEYLIKYFGISGSRIETDGKGATQPIDKANTKEAKANNRRVEFIKL